MMARTEERDAIGLTRPAGNAPLVSVPPRMHQKRLARYRAMGYTVARDTLAPEGS